MTFRHPGQESSRNWYSCNWHDLFFRNSCCRSHGGYLPISPGLDALWGCSSSIILCTPFSWRRFSGQLDMKRHREEISTQVLTLPGGWFNIKMSSYQYRKSYCGDKTILRSSYLHNEISHTGKTASLYWIRALSDDQLGLPVQLVHLFFGSLIITLFNTSRPRRNERHLADDIFKHFFLNENVLISIKISLKCIPNGPINNIPALVQIMAWRRSGEKPLSEPVVVGLPTHLCVTRP